MNSAQFPTSEKVLADLGPTFVNAFIGAVDDARDDFEEFRMWRPSWFPSFTGRFTGNFLHERIWAHLTAAVTSMPDIEVIDEEPLRQLNRGWQYTIRIKRHHPGDRISGVNTPGSNEFWGNAPTFEGMETHTLALGYYWDKDLNEVGEAVLSYRVGKDSPVWAVKLRRNTDEVTGYSWTPVDAPDLPSVDLADALEEIEEGEEEIG